MFFIYNPRLVSQAGRRRFDPGLPLQLPSIKFRPTAYSPRASPNRSRNVPHSDSRRWRRSARCCAHLLSRAGLTVSVESAGRARLPAIMLGEPAQKLIGDIFGLHRPFEGLPRIKRRIVAWGANAEPAAVDHSAIVISEEALLERLGAAPRGERRRIRAVDHLRGEAAANGGI